MNFFRKKPTGYRGSAGAQPGWYHTRSLVWIGLAVLSLLLSRLIPASWIESVFYRHIFQWLRQAYDMLLGWSPIPMLYILLFLILLRVFGWARKWSRGLLHQTVRALGGIAALIVFFYFLWGFNYAQTSLQDRLGYDLRSVGPEDIEIEFDRATRELNTLAQNLPADMLTTEAIMHRRVSDHDLRNEVMDVLIQMDLPAKGRARVRQVRPKGTLLRWSTAGIYIPHTFEGHVDAGLLSVQKPFTIAHEMAHGYGVTDEGACNFLAWMACRVAEDPWVRFSGALTYWRYVAAEMPVDSVVQARARLPGIVNQSLILIRENDKKYPDILPKIRDAIYASYLERHGVKGGLRSYNYVVLMVCEYFTKQSGTPTE